MSSTKKKVGEQANGLVGWAVNLLTLLTTNWAVVVSLLAGVAAWFWNGSVAFLGDSRTLVSAGVFLWALWTLVGISLLRRISRGVLTVPVIEYAHIIMVDSLGVGHNEKSDDSFLSFALHLRNVGNGPLRFEVHNYRIVIGDRTLPESPVLSMVLPRIGVKGVQSPAFRREAVSDGSTGVLDLLIHYGPPEGPMVRKFKLRMNFGIHFTDKGIAVSHSIDSEEDAPL